MVSVSPFLSTLRMRSRWPGSGRPSSVRPREGEGAEREELWRLVNDNYNGYQVYQQRAGQRIIPVVLLEPA
jgi:hypothetical protein